jgi:hypothetical protein|tara:strand:- start:1442 stop:1672 length:231 start_codon:yes stop_codon:yes gene_type:complete
MKNKNIAIMYMYKIVKRHNKEGYWIRKKDKSKIIHHPNNPKLRREQKYTSKNPMTHENATKQLYFLHHILPKKYNK